MAFGYAPDYVFDIAIYAQHCVMAGKVCGNPDGRYGDHWRDSDDIIVYSGTEEKLVKDARDQLAARHDTRAGGMGDAFTHKCARAVLDYLGVPAVEEQDDNQD